MWTHFSVLYRQTPETNTLPPSPRWDNILLVTWPICGGWPLLSKVDRTIMKVSYSWDGRVYVTSSKDGDVKVPHQSVNMCVVIILHCLLSWCVWGVGWCQQQVCEHLQEGTWRGAGEPWSDVVQCVCAHMYMRTLYAVIMYVCNVHVVCILLQVTSVKFSKNAKVWCVADTTINCLYLRGACFF